MSKPLVFAVALLFLSGPVVAGTKNIDQVLLVEKGAAEQLCASDLPSSGAVCVFADPERAARIAGTPDDDDAVWNEIKRGTTSSMTVYRNELGGSLDEIAGRSYYSAVILTERRTPEGQPYFTGFQVAFVSSVFLPGASRLTPLPEVLQTKLSHQISFADSGSPQAEAFVHRLDAPVVRARKMQEEQARRDAGERRKQTPEYLSEAAAEKIRSCSAIVASARRGIQREKRIGEISGYVNKTTLHNYGSMIAACEEDMPRQWQTYKANGGKATTMADLLSP